MRPKNLIPISVLCVLLASVVAGSVPAGSSGPYSSELSPDMIRAEIFQEEVASIRETDIIQPHVDDFEVQADNPTLEPYLAAVQVESHNDENWILPVQDDSTTVMSSLEESVDEGRESDLSPGTARVFGRIFRTDTGHPIRWARVEVLDWDRYSRDDLMARTVTDSTGFFSVTFNNDAGDGGLEPTGAQCDCYVKVHSIHSSIAKVFCALNACPTNIFLNPYSVSFPRRNDIPDGDNNYGNMIVGSGSRENEAFRIFDSVVSAWLYISGRTGVSVPTATIEYPCDGGISLCPGPPYFDVIVTKNIRMKGGQSADTHVHEYGHWVMWKGYGDWWPVDILSTEFTDCLAHSLGSVEGPSCAWSEAWADFLPKAVFNSAALETRGAWPTGDRVEGNIAAALWDLMDTAIDGKDQYSQSFSIIFDTLWNGARHKTFRDFYNDYRARGRLVPASNAAAFQNTINYNNAPRITLVDYATSGNFLTISVTASDDTGGYVDGYIRRVAYQYSQDASTWLAIGTLDIPFPGRSPPYNLAWDISSLIGRDVWIRSMVTDNLDASSSLMQRGPIRIDPTPPTGSMVINNNASITYTKFATLKLTATDPETGSLGIEMRFSNDLATWSAWESFTASKSWTLSPFPTTAHKSVTKSVYVQLRNIAHAGLQSSDSITLATTIRVTTVLTDKFFYRPGDVMTITATLVEQVDFVTIHPLTHGSVNTRIIVQGGGGKSSLLISTKAMTLTAAATGKWSATYGPIPAYTDPLGYQGTYVISVIGTDPPAKTGTGITRRFVANDLLQGTSAPFTGAFSPSRVGTLSFSISVTVRNVFLFSRTLTLQLVLPPGLTTSDPLTKSCSLLPLASCTVSWTLTSTTTDTKLIGVNLLIGTTLTSSLKWYVRGS